MVQGIYLYGLVESANMLSIEQCQVWSVAAESLLALRTCSGMKVCEMQSVLLEPLRLALLQVVVSELT